MRMDIVLIYYYKNKKYINLCEQKNSLQISTIIDIIKHIRGGICLDKKKRFVSILMICILTAVTVLTSSVTATDVQAATPKAIKVQSFKRTGTKTATLKFKKPAKATKYQVRYSFYQDFRPGFTETSKSMKLGAKGKSKKYTTASKKYTTIIIPKSGSTISVKIEDPRLQKITYNYREAIGCSLVVDGTFIEDGGIGVKDEQVYKAANGYGYVGFYCAVQIRYYNKGWSKWSKSVRLNNGYYQEKETKKELSRTSYFVCGDGHPAGTGHNGCGFSVRADVPDATILITEHCMDCQYNIYGNNRSADLVKYAATYTWK